MKAFTTAIIIAPPIAQSTGVGELSNGMIAIVAVLVIGFGFALRWVLQRSRAERGLPDSEHSTSVQASSVEGALAKPDEPAADLAARALAPYHPVGGPHPCARARVAPRPPHEQEGRPGSVGDRRRAPRARPLTPSPAHQRPKHTPYALLR